MTPPRRILLVLNHAKADAERIGRDLARKAAASGWEVAVRGDFPLPADALAGIDLCVVVGGDGTLLGVVQAIAAHPVPVMGVNLGTLGFMANFSAEAAVEELRLLEVRPAVGAVCWALNDLVIKAAASRLARVSVRANGQFVNAYYADGLIVATPTGSTAYNLSAGGPILHPEVGALVITPINPHTLTNRAIVLDGSTELEITLQPADTPVQVAADGVPVAPEAGREVFPLRVRISEDRHFPLLQPPRVSQFDLLRTRMRWMGETPARLQGEES
jgi:NAD+ kinase